MPLSSRSQAMWASMAESACVHSFDNHDGCWGRCLPCPMTFLITAILGTGSESPKSRLLCHCDIVFLQATFRTKFQVYTQTCRHQTAPLFLVLAYLTASGSEPRFADPAASLQCPYAAPHLYKSSSSCSCFASSSSSSPCILHEPCSTCSEVGSMGCMRPCDNARWQC